MGSSKTLSVSEKRLLGLLNASLTSRSNKLKSAEITENTYKIALSHVVVPLIFDPVKICTGGKGAIFDKVSAITGQCSMQNYRLLFETKRICNILEDAGQSVVILKGVAAASFYPVPEYRKSGDIDVLLCDPQNKDKAISALVKHGYHVMQEQNALHQIILDSPTGIDVELHIMLAEPFDNKRINEYIQGLLPDIKNHIKRKDIMGIEIPILDDDYQAFELLLHMLQHFLRRGFGLKLLCDWMAYWNSRYEEDEDFDPVRYKKLISDCRLTGFSDTITVTCCRHLGMKKEIMYRLSDDHGGKIASREVTEAFLREVFDGGEFGDLDKDRMVMLRSRSPMSYIIEFHHQMHLNFPKAGRYPVLWPGLWVYTLARFLYNNIYKRHTSAITILKKTGERSRIMDQIHLWEK